MSLADRVYFTEYKEGVHKDIFRWDWGIGAGSGAATPATSNGKAHDHCWESGLHSSRSAKQ